jgi:kumamolisin
MIRFVRSLLLTAAVMLALVQVSSAQMALHAASVLVPHSSVEHPTDIGVRFHTNTMLKAVYGLPGQGAMKPNVTSGTPPFADFAFETPASLGCVYRLVSTVVPYCNPNVVTENSTGGSRLIAVVDAFDDPNAMSDLNAFSSQFGLPLVTSSTFKVVYASGTQPAQDPTGGWEGEESLDIEMAHAMAPGANLVLVEAATNSDSDLLSAVATASGLVIAAGGGEVLMDWGGSETSDETLLDSFFTASGVVYVSSTGDNPGTQYPSVSPNVVAVGGSTIRRNPFTGNFIGHGAWQDAGGGPSLFEPRPAYQNPIEGSFPPRVQGQRGVPDLSFDGDPNTGAWVYDSIPMSDAPDGGVDGSNWYVFGGTSLSAAAIVGVINVAGHFAASSAKELTRIYNHRTVTSDYHNIASGDTCGLNDFFAAVGGWDYCTGVGTPVGYEGK